MKYLSLFSGIEAAAQAWHDLGWTPVALSEIEPYPCAVLQYHYPEVPNLGDVTKITEERIKSLGAIDIVVFGSPCQDLSIAGKREGLFNDVGNVTRSGLFFHAIDIFGWARKHCGARFALWENVAGAYSSNKGRDFAAVVSHMAGLENVGVPENGWGTEGCAVGDNGMLEWSCLDAQWFGVAQRRRRVFALLDIGDWTGRPPILLEPNGLRGDSPPSRKTGQEITGTLKACAGKSGGWSNSVDHAAAGYMQPVCMAHGQGGAEIFEGLSPTLNCNHEQPIILEDQGGSIINIRTDGVIGTLRRETHGHQPAVLAFAQNTRDEVRIIGGDGKIAGALAAESGMKQQTYVALNPNAQAAQLPDDSRDNSINDGLTCSQNAAVAYPLDLRNALRDPDKHDSQNRQGVGIGNAEEPVPTLNTTHIHGVAIGWSGDTTPKYAIDTTTTMRAQQGGEGFGVMTPTLQVRRLTPVECERLQGFPDGYTLVAFRGKPAADGPRYKALGNSMAVPVMRWIGERIARAIS